MTDTRVDLAIAGSCVRVVQVTDTHLEERRGGTLLGMDTDASLAHVLDLVRDAPLRPDCCSPPAISPTTVPRPPTCACARASTPWVCRGSGCRATTTRAP
jgi:hypothetical protein